MNSPLLRTLLLAAALPLTACAAAPGDPSASKAASVSIGAAPAATPDADSASFDELRPLPALPTPPTPMSGPDQPPGMLEPAAARLDRFSQRRVEMNALLRSNALRAIVVFDQITGSDGLPHLCPSKVVTVDDVCMDERYGGVGGSGVVCRTLGDGTTTRPRGSLDKIVWRADADCDSCNPADLRFRMYIHNAEDSFDLQSPPTPVVACDDLGAANRCNGQPDANWFDGSCKRRRFVCNVAEEIKSVNLQGLATQVLKYTVYNDDPECTPVDPYIVVRPR